MVSRENAVIGTCIALTLAVALAVDSLSVSYPAWVPLALFVGGGVVVPLAINEALDRREAA
jgi:ABC-type arginine/histidine transport system permease subunit